ncbi:MAG TPA: glycosyltransferase [Nitrolancea sp.]|nr:glycosyltransferase [Nitrolancea sp.]
MVGTESRPVSLIVTVKNEEDTLPGLFESIAAQTVQPREVILVDGGSTDRTLDVARPWRKRLPLTIISAPAANISAGRNLALSRATAPIIAVTDAGTTLDCHWLDEISQPFLRPNSLQPDVVCGFFAAHPTSRFETFLGATTLPDVHEIRPARFLPSSRSIAFRRSLFESGITYPEWLDYCEDLIFDLRLKRAKARFEFRPAAVVGFRPRSTLSAYGKQYYRYARGDGKAGLFARRHAVRYATYFVGVPLVLWRRDRYAALATGAGAALYLRHPVKRLMRRRRDLARRDLVLGLLTLPFLRLAGDLAKMVGYPIGLVWRWQRYGVRRTWRGIPEEPSTARGVILEE